MLNWVKEHKQYIVAICVVIIALIDLMVSGHLKRDASENIESNSNAEVVIEPIDLLCRVILNDVGEYDVALATDGNTHVFLNETDKGISSYSVVSSKCKEINAEPVEIDINEYKDDSIVDLYNINENDAMSYIENLIQNNGYTEQARVYTDTFIEGLLQKDSTYTRYIIANNTLVMKDIKEALSTDYYIDNYVK